MCSIDIDMTDEGKDQFNSMDDLYAMFPIQDSGEIAFNVSELQDIVQQGHSISQAAPAAPSEMDCKNLTSNKRGIKKGQSSVPGDNNDQSGDDGKGKQKKIIHRDLERQRRQEMTNLCASLRSLLPLEYIKGKRAISDHMDGAVKYIKQLEESIKELGLKRDKLRRLSDLPSLNQGSRSFNDSTSTIMNRVTVSSYQDGVEIFITDGSTNGDDQVMPLSKVMQVLLEEGLLVVSCCSTRSNGRLIHAIKSEASNLMSIDLSVLQQKMTAVVNMLN